MYSRRYGVHVPRLWRGPNSDFPWQIELSRAWSAKRRRALSVPQAGLILDASGPLYRTAHDAEIRIANTHYHRALDIDPNRNDFLEFMGELYLEMDDPVSASAKLAELERRCPKGCAQYDDLAASIASYRPATPAQIAAPGQLGPAPTE